MSEIPEAVRLQLQALARSFQSRVPAMLDEIDAAFAVRADAPEGQEKLVRLVHTLAGNAGVFGLPAVSRAASALEVALNAEAPEDDLRRLGQALRSAAET